MWVLLDLLIVCACGFVIIMLGQFAWAWWVHDGEQRKKEVDIMQYTKTICMMCGAPDHWIEGLPETPGYYWLCHDPESSWMSDEESRPYMVKVFRPRTFWRDKPKKYLKYCIVDSPRNTWKLDGLKDSYAHHCGPLGPPPSAQHIPYA